MAEKVVEEAQRTAVAGMAAAAGDLAEVEAIKGTADQEELKQNAANKTALQEVGNSDLNSIANELSDDESLWLACDKVELRQSRKIVVSGTLSQVQIFCREGTVCVSSLNALIPCLCIGRSGCFTTFIWCLWTLHLCFRHAVLKILATTQKCNAST